MIIQSLHLTGAAILVFRDTAHLQRPRQVSFFVSCYANTSRDSP
jgi:hypothetical protein